jgi:heme oxygenase
MGEEMTRGHADRLRRETRQLHAEVERAGIMRPLLRGELGRPGYCGLLRNLHEIYCALEGALRRHATKPDVAPIVLPELFRTDALREDLAVLHGEHWPRLLPVPATRRYVARLHEIEHGDAALLVAHAYVRYLGDLSGGVIVRGIVAGSLGLGSGPGLRFYDFGGEHGARQLAERLRRGIDAACSAASIDAVVAEAQDAFRLHARLFEELAA